MHTRSVETVHNTSFFGRLYTDTHVHSLFQMLLSHVVRFCLVQSEEKTGVKNIDTNGEIFTIVGPQEASVRW